MIHFLYCFDENYNKQAFTSMYSLLENINTNIKIHILHNLDKKNVFVPEKVSNHIYLNEIKFYKFKDNKFKFQNIDNTHVSSATYFRLFLQDYIPDYINELIYLDPDTIVISNFLEETNHIFKELTSKKKLIAAKTELIKDEFLPNERFNRLNLTKSYFNAGVMFINYSLWQKENYSEKFIKKMKNLNSKIIEWDQDVMNSLLNGDYLEINKSLNYIVLPEKYMDKKIKPIILHFAGSKKPWLTSGAFTKNSYFYHKIYREIYSESFHIEHKKKLASLKELIFSIFTLKIFNTRNPAKYIKFFLKSLYR